MTIKSHKWQRGNPAACVPETFPIDTKKRSYVFVTP